MWDIITFCYNFCLKIEKIIFLVLRYALFWTLLATVFHLLLPSRRGQSPIKTERENSRANQSGSLHRLKKDKNSTLYLTLITRADYMKLWKSHQLFCVKIDVWSIVQFVQELKFINFQPQLRCIMTSCWPFLIQTHSTLTCWPLLIRVHISWTCCWPFWIVRNRRTSLTWF